MNRTIILHKYILALLLTCLVLGACKKSFLEITPKGKLIAQNTSDYQSLLMNLDLLNMNTDAQMAMGDEVAAVDPYFSGAGLRTQRLFRWDDVIYQRGDDAPELLVPLSNIYLFNKVINEVMTSQGGTDDQKLSIQAQARMGRAWTYFLLINYYGKPYQASSAAKDPGFPIITAADVTASKFTRASVGEVYDFIVKDLTTAIPNLPTAPGHRFLASKYAAEGILGKVYVFMGKFSDGLAQLNNAISDMAGAAIPVGLYDYNSCFAPDGLFQPVGLFGPSTPSAPNFQESLYGKQVFNYWSFYNNELVLTTQTASLYKADDLRLNFTSNMPFPSGTVYPAGMLRSTGPISVQIGAEVPDLYLLRAECKGRLNDLSGAKADVETLRSNRMPPANVAVPPAIAANQISLVKFILEERIREFAMQGYRWFDMRRLSVDPDYSATVGTTHQIYSSDNGTVTSTFQLRPERLTLRFPQKLMDQNPDMQNNP